jgi:hypothetical protein
VAHTRGAENLRVATRGAAGFDLPEVEIVFAESLAASRSAQPADRGSALVAQGVGLMALGRPTAAFARFDSSVALFPGAESAELQAAEWRVIPAALGLPGVSADDRRNGRTRLQAIAAGPGPLAVRAAWALAVDGFVGGDGAAGERWSAQVRRAPDPRAEPLTRLLSALAARARGDSGAIPLLGAVLEADSAGRQPDPFLRAAAHLILGSTLEAAGRPELADRAWLWYENTDVVGLLYGQTQAADVDWAVGTYAGFRRASAALRSPDRTRGCRIAARTLHLWTDPEPGSAGARDSLLAARDAAGCAR